MPVPEQFQNVWPVRRTGSADNERIQLNAALELLMNEVQSLQKSISMVDNRLRSLQSSISIEPEVELLTPVLLQTTNSPSVGDILTYENDDQFTWVTPI